MKIIINKPVLIYVPTFNCKEHILETISKIPKNLHSKIECLVIDNQSNDGTWELLCNNTQVGFKLHLIRPASNLGYAGSQKLAYEIATKNSIIKYVVMLHGDGQYDPSLINLLLEKIDNNFALVNGFRDKKAFSHLEETPFITYYVIKFMNWLENKMTGFNFKEWHSGFVVFSNEFLKNIPFHSLSNSPHFDGEMLILAGILNKSTESIPIYKKYNNHKAFQGLDRIFHVLNTFRTIIKFKYSYYHKLLKVKSVNNIHFEYEYKPLTKENFVKNTQ